MRILISTRTFGGAGGAQRNLLSTIRALRGHEIHVCATEVLPGDLTPDVSQVTLVPRWRYKNMRSRKTRLIWTPIARILRRCTAKYDVYLHYRTGVYVGEQFRCSLQALIPSGKKSDATFEAHFDVVLSQALDGDEFICEATKEIVLPPPTEPVVGQSTAVKGLPQRYLLTVFNPYSAIKGHDLLYEVASDSPHPIVWCHSAQTTNIQDNLHHHERIIHLNDLSQKELRFLYERCRAYVCVSESEGYGWAIADALLYSVPIVSRRLGVLTLYGDDAGIQIYRDAHELKAILGDDSYPDAKYDVERISSVRFAEGLADLVREHSR